MILLCSSQAYGTTYGSVGLYRNISCHATPNTMWPCPGGPWLQLLLFLFVTVLGCGHLCALIPSFNRYSCVVLQPSGGLMPMPDAQNASCAPVKKGASSWEWHWHICQLPLPLRSYFYFGCRSPRWVLVVLVTTALNALLFLAVAIYCSCPAVYGIMDPDVDRPTLVPLSFLGFVAWAGIAVSALFELQGGQKVAGDGAAAA